MRLSLDRNDVGYAPMRAIIARRGRVEVVFNGEKQRDCTLADEATGEIVRHVRRNGNLVKDAQRRILNLDALPALLSQIYAAADRDHVAGVVILGAVTADGVMLLATGHKTQ